MERKFFVIMSMMLTVSGIVVDQSDQGNITEGDCFGNLSYFLCNCFNHTSDIDLHLSEGDFSLTEQPQSSYCLLDSKVKVTISGTGNGTRITCSNFMLVVINSSNIVIQNLLFINCGHFVDESIKETYRTSSVYSYFGEQSRVFILLYNSVNISLRNIVMDKTLGYGVLSVNALGFVKLYNIMVVNTTFENDEKCMNYNYNVKGANHLCSGSGIVFIYRNNGKRFNMDTVVMIDNCVFENNKNAIPFKDFNDYASLINSGFFQKQLPIIGAASITFYYAQNEYNVTSSVFNSMFHNNNGTLTASVIIIAISSSTSRTIFDRCLFVDNNRQGSDSIKSQLYRQGGVAFYYLQLSEVATSNSIVAVEMFSMLRSNFTQLGGSSGERLGVAIHLEKISPDYVSIIVTIKQCNFFSNEVSIGSAIYAKDTPFYSSSNVLANGRLHVNLEDINVNSSIIPPGVNIYYTSGAIYFANCQVTLKCNELCKFMHNQVSVFYGQNGELSVIGNLSLRYNSAFLGGAIYLQNTVLYIEAGSTILISQNYAVKGGGGIYMRFPNTGFQAKDTCPIQFIGTNSLITDYDDLSTLNLTIIFEENYIGDNSSVESINANVFYLCTWYPGTSVGITMNLLVPVENNTRRSVYHEIFSFKSQNVNNHVYIFALVSCPCNRDGNFSLNIPTCITGGTVSWSEPVVPGWTFSIDLTALTVVGDVGYSRSLSSSVSGENRSLVLKDDQLQRPFFVNRTTCTPVEFTVYLKANKSKPSYGLLTLEINLLEAIYINITLIDCPKGYKMQKSSDKERYGCVCDNFFTEKHVRGAFQCSPGAIIRKDMYSWLGIIQNDLEYMASCLPTHCNNYMEMFNLSSDNVLCINHHAGRACGGCLDGYSKVFGSSICKQCSNAWLATLLLYGLLGILLLLLIYQLQLTVTIGAINGLIFFCNCMSINEELFFNTKLSNFSFLRAFISFINLELGFEICFYDGMSQVLKTGLQFVFPMYLGLMIMAIVFLTKYYNMTTFSHSALSILATLIILSYLKLLRTVIEIISFLQVHSAKDGVLIVWRSDPNIKYFTGGHIVLFIISFLFFFLFIVPFAIGFTFPKIVLRSKRLSHFFPLVDCFVAPYKDNYRYWFGVRVLVLIVLSIVDAAVVQFTEVVLVTSIAGVGLFAIIQAYIHPFKNTIINLLDLIFMEIFLLLSALTLYFYPSENGYDDVNIVVTVFGYCAFLLFCLLILHQLHAILKGKKMYNKMIKKIQGKHEQLKKIAKPNKAKVPIHQDKVHLESIGVTVTYNHYRESLLEYF